ncbi:MAG: hypothetical protein HOQ45_03910, partial [Nocardioidaceae bacterium]|nr:hypothetical protein [Nocardioidaceae bacterium]
MTLELVGQRVAPTTVSSRVTPWATAVPLAVVLALVDGFWVVAVRGAVGAFERNEGPFTSWLLQSVFTLPLFLLAVLGGLQAARWLRSRHTLLAPALLVAGTATLAGAVALIADAGWNLNVQLQHLGGNGGMGGMGGLCDTVCQGKRYDHTIALQVHGVEWGVLILLAANLITVGWLMALRGGRMGRTNDVVPARSRRHALQVLVAAGLLGAAAVHLAVLPAHLADWGAAGVFLVLAVLAQAGTAALLLWGGDQRVGAVAAPIAAIVVSAGPLLVWLWSRTVGLSFGPQAGTSERVGTADVSACVLELLVIVLALLLLSPRRAGAERPTSPAGLRFAVVAVLAVAALGVG